MPDTLIWMVFGYLVIFGILGSYLLSLAWRGSKVVKALKALEASTSASQASGTETPEAQA